MTSSPIIASASVVILALTLAVPAEAAKVRKHKKLAAPQTVAATSYYRGANLFPPGPVMYGNQYLGTDPDPFIRSQLLRDLGAHFGGDD